MIPNLDVEVRPGLSETKCQSATYIKTRCGYRSRANRHICGIDAVHTLHIPPLPKRRTHCAPLQNGLLSLKGAAVPSSPPNQISSFSSAGRCTYDQVTAQSVQPAFYIGNSDLLDDVLMHGNPMKHELGIHFYVGSQIWPTSDDEIIRVVHEVGGCTERKSGTSAEIEVETLSAGG